MFLNVLFGYVFSNTDTVSWLVGVQIKVMLYQPLACGSSSMLPTCFPQLPIPTPLHKKARKQKTKTKPYILGLVLKEERIAQRLAIDMGPRSLIYRQHCFLKEVVALRSVISAATHRFFQDG